jgi:membrane protein YqaA with SNARE-associated domain
MEAFESSVGIWGLFVSAFISATVAPGGSEAVLAFLIIKSDLSPVWLLFIATVGNTLGAVTTWLLGLLAAMGWPVERFTKEYSQRALYSVHRWGTPALLFSWLPVIGDALCFAAGWLRFPFLASLIAIAIGKAARYAVVIYTFM